MDIFRVRRQFLERVRKVVEGVNYLGGRPSFHPRTITEPLLKLLTAFADEAARAGRGDPGATPIGMLLGSSTPVELSSESDEERGSHNNDPLGFGDSTPGLDSDGESLSFGEALSGLRRQSQLLLDAG